MKNKDNDIVFIKHIMDAIINIENFTKNINFENFNKDILKSNAVIRMFEIIGEASNNISNITKNKYTYIPWRIMKDMRNFLIHQYFGVDNKTIWDTIINDLPELKIAINKLINDIKK